MTTGKGSPFRASNAPQIGAWSRFPKSHPHQNLLYYVSLVFGFEIFLLAFRFLDWNRGLARTALLGLVLLLLFALRYCPQWLIREATENRHWKRAVLGLVALAAAWNISVMAFAIAYTVKTDEVRSDMGQSTYRAALELSKGRNPYGRGALLSFQPYLSRMPQRLAAGLRPTIPAPAVEAALERYWKTLDPGIREELLPTVAPAVPFAAPA
jgi:hypothetical protein